MLKQNKKPTRSISTNKLVASKKTYINTITYE